MSVNVFDGKMHISRFRIPNRDNADQKDDRFPQTVHKILLAAIISLWFLPANAQINSPIEPLPLKLDVNASLANIGKKLFFDQRLSVDDSVSCASCHDLEKGFGTDLKKVSTGINGLKGNRNSPTVINSGFNFKQFWDGRADNLHEQAKIPITNPVEMGMPNLDMLVEKVSFAYNAHFERVLGRPTDIDAIASALAEYQKTLVTQNAPIDRYLRGDKAALTAQQVRGLQLFQSYGCSSCHQGRNVGGNMFQKFGVLKDINLLEGGLNADLGRYEVTKNEWDKRVFKVPSLRLAVHTPPYFHDGSVKTIEEAVDIMIQFQLGRKVPEEDRAAIIAFLHALPGELPPGVKP